VTAVVRACVLEGRRLRMLYAAAGQEPRWRTVDPVGLVTVRGRTYLDDQHARWAAWQLAADAEVRSPSSVRAALHDRAAALVRLYRPGPKA
jgi:predicted DNA-binding transcriptional regulator YafY